MIPEKVMTALLVAIDSGNNANIVTAMPDHRLIHPVGDIDFPGRQFNGENFHYLAPALAASGVYGA